MPNFKSKPILVDDKNNIHTDRRTDRYELVNFIMRVYFYPLDQNHFKRKNFQNHHVQRVTW